MEAQGEEIIYHVRNQEKKPIATVALRRCGDFFSRGIAVCSPCDQFDRTIGRWYAAARAEEGVKIIEQGFKPQSPKQIKHGRYNNPCILKDRFKDPKLNDHLQFIPTPFKISTFPKEFLTPFEMNLVEKVKR